MTKNKKRGSSPVNIKKLTVCSMLSALGVVLLALGAIVDVLDISVAVLASVCVIIAQIEYGKSAPWLVFATISVLSFLLLPSKLPAIFFALFFGFYPIVKEKAERLCGGKKRRKALVWILKELIFNLSLALIILLHALFFFTAPPFASVGIYVAVIVIISEAVFLIYDVALTRIISFYIFKIKPRIKFKF